MSEPNPSMVSPPAAMPRPPVVPVPHRDQSENKPFLVTSDPVMGKALSAADYMAQSSAWALDAAFGSWNFPGGVPNVLNGMRLRAANRGEFIYTSRGRGRNRHYTPLITAEEANRRYGIEGVLHFDQPVHEGYAKLKYALKHEEIVLRDKLDRAEGGVLPATARFAASQLGSLQDPLNAALALAPIPGARLFRAVGAARALKLRRTLPEALQLGSAPAWKRIGRTVGGTAHDTLGGIGKDIFAQPFISSAAQAQGAEYDPVEAMMGILHGSFVDIAKGTALHFLRGKGRTTLHSGQGNGAGHARSVAATVPFALRDASVLQSVGLATEARPARATELFAAQGYRDLLQSGSSLDVPDQHRAAPPFSSSGLADRRGSGGPGGSIDALLRADQQAILGKRDTSGLSALQARLGRIGFYHAATASRPWTQVDVVRFVKAKGASASRSGKQTQWLMRK